MKKAAEQGEAIGQVRLGFVYETGKGVTQDHELAIFWLRRAAEQGIADAQEQLGALYRLGCLFITSTQTDGTSKSSSSVPQSIAEQRRDPAQAAVWYRKAAEQGSLGSQYYLGELYRTGTGVPQDYSQAYFWLNLAAAGNFSQGQKAVIEARDAAASHLTNTALLQSQERVRKWVENHKVSGSNR